MLADCVQRSSPRRSLSLSVRHFASTVLNPAGGISTCLTKLDASTMLRAALRDVLWPARHFWRKTLCLGTPSTRFVKRIPRGKVVTYGAVAKAIKLKGGARTAGHAMAATPKGQAIPWHRVVGSGGRLLIREPYASLQRKLLASEGAKITETRVDMKTSAWTPPPKNGSANPRNQSRRRGVKPKVTSRKRA